MKIIGLPALVGTYDNYIWVLYQDAKAWVVDPGESQQVIDFLKQHNLALQGILVTHHHFDHVDGIPALKQAYPNATVFGGKKTNNACIQIHLSDGDEVELVNGFTLNVLETPGHTPDHISYYNEHALFCADALFTAGCGRLLGGTIEEFSQSLIKLRNLPEHTPFYCAHEYTKDNVNFAIQVEPNNSDLQQRLASLTIHYPAIKTQPLGTLKQEKQTNPFLRFDLPDIKTQLLKRGANDNIASLFKTLRAWKDQYDQQS
ncbi:MAG: hydroxyacylglutathione hydrolase [Thiomicrorhabdus sp.]|nr:hydroxyacylglutathione hydrolase [Thiomicrorhabdus sp.]